MKGLGVYYHCAKAEFVTLFGPRAMGQAPLKHGVNYSTVYCMGAEGPKKYLKE